MADPVTPQPQPAMPNAEIDALVLKHHVEIDRIQSLDSAGQQAALKSLGVDPAAIAEHYKGLVVESDQLRREDAAASKKTETMGWASAAVAATGALAAGKKLGSWVVRMFMVPVIAMTAGVLGVFAGSRIFSGNIRERSKQLNLEARNALDRELAVALENRDRSKAAPPAAVPAEAPAETATLNVAPRNPSFAAQAAGEKAAAASAGTQRA